jgi:protein-tyrosine phosphatase
MIDLHSHLLPGIDDGSRSVQQSVDALRRFVELGITDVVLTPHLRAADIPNRSEEIIERRDLLLTELRQHAPSGIHLHPGFEIMLDAAFSGETLADRRLALAGSRYYLVEFPMSVGGAPATAALGQVVQAGVVPLVAHPERYLACTVRDFRSWVSLGAVLQVDATSMTRPTARGDMGRKIIQAGLAHVLAADNHGDRRTVLTGRRYLEERGAEQAAHWLTTENPRAVLEDRPMAGIAPVKLKLGVGERVKGWIREVKG